MCRYIFSTVEIEQIENRDGTHCEMSIFDCTTTPEKHVDVSNMACLQQQFDLFAGSLRNCGVCYRVFAGKDKRDPTRKFNGFDKAADRGGALNTLVNEDIAIVVAVADREKKQAAA